MREWEVVDDLAGELSALDFERDPLRASVLGLPGAHDRLPDPSAAAEQRFRERYVDIVERAERAEGDQVTKGVVLGQARMAIDLIDSRLTEFAVSDAFAAPLQVVLLTLPTITLEDEERASGYLARLAGFPSFVDKLIERQRGGPVPPEFLVDFALAYCDRHLADPDADPLRVGPGGAERDKLLAEVVRPAIAGYREFLATEVKPAALPSDKAGMCWQDGGEERYAKLIRAHTTTDRSARELHETGLRLIDSLAGEYRELGERVFGTRDLAEIFERLRTDPELRWGSGEELLESARVAIRAAEAVAPQWFRTIPEQRCDVRAVPAAEAESGTIAYYVEPALDGSRPGVYYANTARAEERFRHTSEAIAFHEAVPGHHFQIALALGLTDLPLLRRIADFNAYLEGWGLYAERLADEMGLYTSDLTRMGMLTQDSMRAGRLVVDTGLHALGWSRQQAVAYLRDNTPMSPVEIEAEVDRYAGCPGQALSYMTGRLEIQRLRGEAERALGAGFDIREFHDVVLGNGILPLPVLADVVGEWVRRRVG
ncbi:DUF885 domain-containing protein [Amycolatopsis acidicola]|uniref:DUF885 domain-containing protein n=1 Tax=Amycolatopsis acidicola TaxID=2596893 RepID=A0A5N0UMQ0_9PSEU|nr:DUF885 domain-containing protein [Amycolatopsis acidicola]KAA9151208.1 DUF885 domain-containing protein [Amycolatopsis acidicola]